MITIYFETGETMDLPLYSLANSILNGAVMHGAALMNATLVGVQMKRADLSSVIAVGADFTEADLSSSGLKNADVFGASFVRANLCDVNFDVKRIENASFSGAIYNEGTVWPEGFDPIMFGATKI